MPVTRAEKLVETEELDVLKRLRELAPPGFVLKISRREPHGRDDYWLADWATDTFPDEAELSATFGGGDFLLEVRNADKTYIKGGRARLKIAGPAKEPPAAAATTAVDATVKFTLEAMRDMMKERQPQPKALDVPAMILAVSTAIGTLAKLLERPSAQGGIGELVKGMKDLAELQQTLTPEAPAPSVGGGDNIYAAIINALGKLADVVREQRQAPPAPAPGAPPSLEAPPDAPADAQPPAIALDAEDTAALAAGPEWLGQLLPYMPQLLELAEDDANPELYADVILDQVERRQPLVLDFLRAKLAGDPGEAAGFAQQILAGFPKTKPYADWFGELFAAMRTSLLEDATAELAGGDDPKSHGAAAIPSTPQGPPRQ